MTAAAFGTKAEPCPMGEKKRWMRMQARSFVISHLLTHPEPQATSHTHIASQTLTASQPYLGRHGPCTRTSHSPAMSRTSALYGICFHVKYPWARQRKLNTLKPLWSGTVGQHTPLMKFKDCTESCYTPAWLSLQGDLTSPTWRSCSGPFTTVLSSQGLPPAALQAICSGGSRSSGDLSWEETSPDLANLLISARSRTLARVSASGSLSGAAGGHGDFYQAGNAMKGTSGGLRPSDLNSLSGPSLPPAQRQPTSRFMEITRVSSKAGGTDAAVTTQLTASSAGSTDLLMTVGVPSTHATSLALSTPPMPLHGESTRPAVSFYRPSPFPTSSENLSSTMMLPSPSGSFNHGRMAMHRSLNRNRSGPYPTHTSPSNPRSSAKAASSSQMLRAGGTRNPDHWDKPLPTASRADGRPKPYAANLAPFPSLNRPHVLARDRLRLWVPLQARNSLDENGKPVNVSPADLARIEAVMLEAWAEGTRDTYGSGLLVWHVFHDKRATPEAQRAPASFVLIAAFIASIAGAYSGKTIANYVYGVRAWHILHGAPWLVDGHELEALLSGATHLTPATSKRKKRLPYTVDLIVKIRRHLDLDLPLHASVYSCLTTTFWAAGRVGEFTVKTLTAFDPTKHVKPADVADTVDRNGLKMTEFSLPVTKSAPEGEKASWAEQDGDADPKTALNNHRTVNSPPADGPLFAYKDGRKHKPLTKSKFLQVLGAAIKQAGHEPMQGHGIRIGATLEYLLRGVPFDVMKTKGRWASNAFELYLTKHAQILAPYMQANPAIHNDFVRYTMPRVR
ncbi:hypothetical protein K438DRAFT_1878853 [Mycena galopus ATCC 62051]|nr:hypothetical protein K438DRAFT_1878853 [Mycena galopus ATCC 62051]